MSERERIGVRANRTQSKRAIEREEQEKYLRGLKYNVLDGLEVPSDDDSDDDYGKTHASKVAKRKKSGVSQLLKQQGLQPMQALTPSPTNAEEAPPELDEEFKPLQDLKGVAANNLVGRRITVWYYDDASEQPSEAPAAEAPAAQRGAPNATHGIVTYYGAEGRMFVVFDGEEESEGGG